MQAVILAGGKGTRLHPLTANIPKPMVPLFDRPVMEHCICLLARHGITDIIVTVSYLARDIMRYFGDGSRLGVKIRYSVETEPLGTAGGVKLIQEMIDDTFVVVSGDAVTDFDFRAAIEKHRAASAIATLLLHQVEDPTQFGIVECDPEGYITHFVEKPRSSEVFTNTVNTGIYIMEPDALSCIPYFQPYDFARELFPRMLNNREPVYGFAMPGYWCDVGNLLQYRNVHFDALEGRVDIDIPATHLGEGVWLGERVEIHSSVDLAAPVFLGDGVTVRGDSVLGERTVIGAETLVDEAAHIARSVIGSRSFVGRNTRVTDCIIGSSYSIMDSESVYDRTLVEHMHYQPTAAPAPRAPVAEGTIAQVAQQMTQAQRSAA